MNEATLKGLKTMAETLRNRVIVYRSGHHAVWCDGHIHWIKNDLGSWCFEGDCWCQKENGSVAVNQDETLPAAG